MLVHGTFANRNDNWQTYAPLLANGGYCVFALNYGSNAAYPEFIEKMRAGGRGRGVRYTNIVTVYDELVVPYWSGIEPGMRNIVLQNVCPRTAPSTASWRRHPTRHASC